MTSPGAAFLVPVMAWNWNIEQWRVSTTTESWSQGVRYCKAPSNFIIYVNIILYHIVSCLPSRAAHGRLTSAEYPRRMCKRLKNIEKKMKKACKQWWITAEDDRKQKKMERKNNTEGHLSEKNTGKERNGWSNRYLNKMQKCRLPVVVFHMMGTAP